jgi:hypothetical protein
MKYLLLAGGLLVMAACQNKTPKTPQEVIEQAAKAPGMNAGAEKFSLSTPEGWQRLDTTMNGAKITFLFAPTLANGFRPNINVVTEDMRGTDVDAYFKKNISVMSQYMQNFQEGKITEKDVNGVKVKYMEYSHSQNGLDMDVTMALLPINGIAYVVTVTTQKGERAQYQPQFNQVIESFKAS